MTLELTKTPDILSDVSRNRTNGLLVVGFAAETTDVVGYARSKMEKKDLDIVVANDITAEGAGFQHGHQYRDDIGADRSRDRSAADVKTRDG